MVQRSWQSPEQPGQQQTPRYLRVITSRLGISRQMEIWGGKAHARRLAGAVTSPLSASPAGDSVEPQPALRRAPAGCLPPRVPHRLAGARGPRAGPRFAARTCTQPGDATSAVTHCQPSRRTVLILDALKGPQVGRPQGPRAGPFTLDRKRMEVPSGQHSWAKRETGDSDPGTAAEPAGESSGGLRWVHAAPQPVWLRRACPSPGVEPDGP